MNYQDNGLVPYISGPLTEIPLGVYINDIENLYDRAAKVIKDILGVEAFVPHRQFIDPTKKITPGDIYQTDVDQIMNRTSFLLVFGIGASWGGGGECQLANNLGIPIFIFKPVRRPFSSYVLGMPLVQDVIEFHDFEDALEKLKNKLIDFAR